MNGKFRLITKAAGVYLLISFSVLLHGCADIEEVNSAAKTAIATLGTYNDLGYSFTESYRKYTVPQYMYKGFGDKAAMPNMSFRQGALDSALKADQVVGLFFSSLTSYFETLSRLSDKDLANADFSNLGDAIKSDDKFLAKLGGVSKDQVDASVKIATLLANDLMGAYREKQVRKVICDYDGDVMKVFKAADRCLGLLLQNMESDFDIVRAKYTPVATAAGDARDVRIHIIEQYTAECNTLQAQKTLIEKLRAGTARIGEMHHALATKLKENKLTSEEARSLLKHYVGDAHAIYEQIKLLRKN